MFFADFDFWFGGIADASPEQEFQPTAKRKNDAAETMPAQPDQQQQPNKKQKTFTGKVKRIPGSLGRVFEPRQFDINMCKADYTYVFYGRRRSGKSYLMRWLLYKLRKQFPRGLCITKTPMNGYCKA